MPLCLFNVFDGVSMFIPNFTGADATNQQQMDIRQEYLPIPIHIDHACKMLYDI